MCAVQHRPPPMSAPPDSSLGRQSRWCAGSGRFQHSHSALPLTPCLTACPQVKVPAASSSARQNVAPHSSMVAVRQEQRAWQSNHQSSLGEAHCAVVSCFSQKNPHFGALASLDMNSNKMHLARGCTSPGDPVLYGSCGMVLLKL